MLSGANVISTSLIQTATRSVSRDRLALNRLNQSKGRPDLYPFVLAPTVKGKLRFVQGLIYISNA